MEKVLRSYHNEAKPIVAKMPHGYYIDVILPEIRYKKYSILLRYNNWVVFNHEIEQQVYMENKKLCRIINEAYECISTQLEVLDSTLEWRTINYPTMVTLFR